MERTLGETVNFYEDLLECLTSNGKNVEQILWVGTRSYRVPWERFKNIAMVTEYPFVFFSNPEEVACDIIVVGDYWWLSRHDEFSMWKFNQPPSMPTEIFEGIQVLTYSASQKCGLLKAMNRDSAFTLKELNGDFSEGCSELAF